MMRRPLLIAAALASVATAVEAKDSADTVYINGEIYTVNQDQPWAEAVVINEGNFRARRLQ